MTGSGVGTIGAVELAEGLRAGRYTAASVMDDTLAAIEAREADLRAWVTLDRERARRAARAADVRRQAGLPLGPLHGVPFGVKDIFDVADMPTRAGFGPYEHRVAARDSVAVARLRAAGAIPVGKTETTQFALADPRATRNPWHPDRTPGGSSSGSAAAVGAGTISLTLGSQTAGSVLRPAAYCGAVGFKPSWGRIPLDGILPLAWSLDHPGVIARRAVDCEVAYGVLADDPSVLVETAAPPRLLLLREFRDRSSPATAANLASVAETLTAAGADVVEGDVPVSLDRFLAVQTVIMGAESAAAHVDSLRQHADEYGPRLRASLEAGHLIPAHAYLHADRLRARYAAEVDAHCAAERVDALLMPTAGAVAPARETTGDRSFQAPWSLLGVPAITLPTGFDADGLPFGTQLVARRGHDRALLRLARWVEAALAG